MSAAQDLCMRCCGVANGWCLRSGYVMDALCPLGVLGASFMVLAGPSARRHLLEDAALFLCIVFFVYTQGFPACARLFVYTRTLCAYTMQIHACVSKPNLCIHMPSRNARVRVCIHIRVYSSVGYSDILSVY